MVTRPLACTVLVVDDNLDIRSGLSRLLQRAGYTVATAVNGSDALDYLHRHAAPSLILLDLLMPVMDGWRFLRVWHDDRFLAGIPVLVCSSEARPEGSPFADITGFLPKPVDADELLSLVASICASGQPPVVPP